jgi:hypothetical protein
MIPHQALILWRMLTTAYGPKLPISDVCFSAALRGKADINQRSLNDYEKAPQPAAAVSHTT